MSNWESMLDSLKGYKFTREEYPALYETLDRYAKALGMQETPTLYKASAQLDAVIPTPNAFSASEKTMLVNDKFLRMIGIESGEEAQKIGQTLDEGLAAVLAHEMHHCGNRTSMMMMTRAPLLLFPTAALIGTYLYGRALSKTGDAEDKQALNKQIRHDAEALSKVVDRDAAKSTDPEIVAASHKIKKTIGWGSYLAAGALGIGAGLVACRYGARFHEFAADKFMAEHANKEAGMAIIEKLTHHVEAMVERMGGMSGFSKFINETIMHHPTVAERKAAVGLAI